MKKKILALCLVVVLAVTAVTGATLAYFTDTKSVQNTFTTGSLSLKLDERKVKQDETTGDYIADGDTRIETTQAYDLHPGQDVLKDPKMTLTISDGDNAYLAAKVVITAPDLIKLYNAEHNYVDFTKVVKGGVTYPGTYEIKEVDTAKYDATVSKLWNVTAGGETFYLTQEVETEIVTDEIPVLDKDGNPEKNGNGSDKVNEVERTVVKSVTMCYYFTAKKSNANTITLFDHLVIPADWTNSDMANLEGMTIDVTGYATQTESFTDCLDAMSKAFGDDLSVIKKTA